MFRRARYEPEWIERAVPFRNQDRTRDKAGYTQEYQALANASWYVEHAFAKGFVGSNHEGLYAWESLDDEVTQERRVNASDPGANAQKVKKAARLFGASLVGICELDRRWLYSRVSDDITGEHLPQGLTEDYRYAVAIAIEMDYDFMQTSPTGGAGAATGLGYSKMAFVAGLLAQFIRGLGYKAAPSGNDTALSIPIAVEAGLGEMGRNGLLITEEFGPRVRICKVFTDLPLAPDQPHFFGVDEFCRTCMKCATDCPSRAIPFEGKTTEAPTMSNNSGVLKWPVNPEQCYKFWIANRMDCANCIRVCPFNQEPGWYHDLVRGTIKKTSLLNPLFLWFDNLLEYGKQRTPETIWED
jgi:reductive dehalogenase